MVRFLLHSYGQFDRRHPLTPVIWPHFDILFIHAGRLSLQYGEEREILLHREDGILIFPHTSFHGRALTSAVRASVQHFALEETHDPVLARLAGRSHGAWTFSAKERPGLTQDIERALALAARTPGAYVQTLRIAQLQLIVGEIGMRRISGNKTSPLPAAFTEVLNWARNNPSDLSIATLAKRAGYSPSHFRALFARHLDATPGNYFRLLKVNEARRLLRETRQPLKQIAETLGYADAVSFHRSFTTATGHTPHSYRQRHAPRG